MKKVFIGAAVAAMAASPAFAQSKQDDAAFEVKGNVQQECSIGDISTADFQDIEINEGPGDDALNLVDGSEEAGTQDVYFSCNYGATISASSLKGGMENAAGASLVLTDPDDFTNLIHYRILVTSPDGDFNQLDFQTDGGGGPSVNTGAFHDLAKVRVYLDADETGASGAGKRPVAGDYTDTATITLGAV